MAAVDSRYARAFADVVGELKLDSSAVVNELRSAIGLFESSQELRRVWENPSISAQSKHRLLDAIVVRLAISKPVRNFLAVLIDHRRIVELPRIGQYFERELNERMGLAEAEITSARQLADHERRDLEAQVSKLTGKRVLAKYKMDPGLLGGAVVKVGSTVYDGSVRGQLQKIREQLSGS